MKRKKILAWLLTLCLIIGMVPGVTLSAAAAGGKTVYVGGSGEGHYATLQEAYAALGGAAGTIMLTGNTQLTEPLRISSDVEISGSGTISPTGGNWTATNPGNSGAPYNTMIQITGGTVTMGPGVIVDANSMCRCISVNTTDGAAKLVLDGTRIQNGAMSQAHGAGIILQDGAELEASGGARFESNICDSGTVASGGALYVWRDSKATLDDVTFTGNKANSGGAIYTYRGTVTTTANTKFVGNWASQRGGAIHDHGLVVLHGTTISGNSSDQYGGGVYVSADIYLQGQLVMDNATITGNSAGNSGAGVFVATDAQLFLGGSSSVNGNNLTNAGSVPADYLKNNIYVATATSKLIIYSDLSKESGISTSNPYWPKVVVYSLATSGVSFPSGTGVSADSGYMISSDTKAKLSYDSAVWLLKDTASDPGAAAEDPNCKEGNLWLGINPDYGGGDPSADTVIFDFNLPGKEAIVYTGRTPGTTISLPSVSNESTGAVTYKFRGWYTEPVGGSKLSDPLTVEAGTHVYYAQWDVQTDSGSGGGGVPGDADMYLVYFDQNYEGGGLTTAYVTAGTFSFTVEFEGPDGMETEVVEVDIPFEFPGDPARDGYTFRGWGTSADSNSPVDQGSWAPTEKVTTLYGIWEPDTYTLTWDANGGNGGTTTTQERDSIVVPPSTTPTREGYDFTGWYLDQDCTTPLVSGTVVKQSATYYAGWTPKEYTITWDTNYTNGSVTTIQQKYDDELNILPDPIRTGYEFGGWYTEPNGGGTRAEAYGTVKGNETFYANWVQESIDYTVTIEWDDDSDNDAVRPDSITVELTRNDLPTGMTYTFTEADADGSGNKWSHTFTNLPKTDSISQEYTYSVAITSSVSDEYSYGIENKSATLGYILMTHTLITRDVNTYIVWDDAKDQDGQRPAAVQVQLCANGKPVEDAEASTTLAGDGDTWSYTFEDFQKYYTTDDGEKGQEIVYTIEVTPVTPGELDAYTIEYSDYTAILHHELETVTRQVVVEWADNNNQDGKRPASMVVQLYADNVPMPGKSVVLSDANKWTYTWSDLPKYSTAGKEVAYSAHVTSTLVDYTAATTEMTIEMTYVPSSTTISAFATWEDGEDVDGLRPETLTVELYADGEPTGDRQVISVDTGWTVSWSNYPIYKDGSRIEYTFQIVDVPDGYDAEYYGIYDTSGLSVLLTHNRILANQEVTITWDDQDNAALARPAKVEVMLYADGVPLTDQTAIITEADGWAHTFEGRPVYRDGGVPIKYSAYVVSAVGEYIPSTDGLHITMGYEVETVDIPLSIIWDDDNDRDGQRPVAVVVTLTIDGEPTAYQSMATEENGWTVLFEGFAAYAQSDKGHKINYGVVVTEPKGYTATYAGSTCLLTYAPETTSATPILYWRDNNDQYGQRPGKVTVSLLADGQPTGKTVQVYAADNWTAQPFTNLPRYDGQREIVYSINVTGELSNYTVTVDGMNAYLTHNATGGEEYTRDYTATVTWADNEDALGSRPDSIKMTLYADGAEYDTYTMTAADAAGGQNWVHTFTDLPTKQSGKTVTYSIGIEALPNYAEQIEGPSITMVHSEDVVVTVRWADNNNQDGQRPEELTLRLLADKLDAGRTATLAGDSEADTWVLRMDKVPVWSTVNTGREIDYTYLLDAASASRLEAAGYSVQYNGYELGEGSEIGGTLLYTLDLSRDAEIADYTATVTWDDDTDRDGQRPESLTVELYADGESTGLTAKMTGGNEAESWNHVFEALPVHADQGNVIVYTLVLVGDAPSGYTVVPDQTKPAMELKHEISRTDVTATVTWDHESDINGLEPIDLYVELTVDGVATGEVAKLTAANNWSYTWPGRYVYHDHGTAYEYSFIVSEQSLSQLPDGVEVVVDGTEGTVIHSTFRVSGTVEDAAGFPVEGATVSVYDSDKALVCSTIVIGNPPLLPYLPIW